VLFNPAALTELRRIKGISKSQLADKTKLSRPYITQLEGELRKTPSPDALNLLAQALGVEDTHVFFLEPSIDDLLRELAAARAREQVSA
jgi:transcriptional regulator with XRE-family HTH domain